MSPIKPPVLLRWYLVEDEEARVAHERTRKRDALPLPT
jgi:hypothetical protein